MTAPVLPNARENREAWLSSAARLMARGVFAPAGWSVPSNVRFSCSWPSRAALARKCRRIGEAWSSEAAADGYFGIMISQSVDDPATVVSILAHELVHVTVGLACGHKGAFKRCAQSIGLEGPMTSTVAGEAFKRAVAPVLEELGPYPHGAIGPVYREDDTRMSTRPKPQKGRLLKARCEKCDLTLRLTRTWIQNRTLGCPDLNCPGHSRSLTIS